MPAQVLFHPCIFLLIYKLHKYILNIVATTFSLFQHHVGSIFQGYPTGNWNLKLEFRDHSFGILISIIQISSYSIFRNGVIENPFPVVEYHKNQSVVYVGVDNNLAGLIYFEDQIREDAKQIVEALLNQGINVYMLSGDKRNTAEYVASVVGIPKDKVRKRPVVVSF